MFINEDPMEVKIKKPITSLNKESFSLPYFDYCRKYTNISPSSGFFTLPKEILNELLSWANRVLLSTSILSSLEIIKPKRIEGTPNPFENVRNTTKFSNSSMRSIALSQPNI